MLNAIWPGIPDDQTDLGREIRLRQFLAVAQSVTTISGINLVNVLLTTFLFWNVLPPLFLLPWMLVSVALSANRVWGGHRAKSKSPPSRIRRQTIVRSTIWSAISGTMWGAVAIAMAQQDSILHQIFLAFVVGGQAVAAAVWLSPILSASYAYIWLSMAPLVISLALIGHQMATVMAGMLTLFLIASFQLTRRIHADFVANIADKMKLDNLYDQLGDSEERLITAIETIDAGFALFDADDRLVMANSRHREFYESTAGIMLSGVKFEDMLRESVSEGIYPFAIGHEEKWLAERMAKYHNPRGSFEQLLADNRWLQLSEYRTKDGGLVSVSTDITQLKQTHENLKVALDQAENANLAKSEFLTSMSHELRTPLNAILGFAQLMETDPDANYTANQTEFIQQIMLGGDHLLELINQVLDLSRIETGSIDVSIEEVLLSEVLKQTLPLAESFAREQNIALVVSPFDENILVLGDVTRIKQVLLNLLSNAIKYNIPGGQVTIEFSPSPEGNLVISIIDNGSGIPLDKQAKVFDPFDRLGAETSDAEGTGIGLTITKQLLQLMNGEIGFDSTPGIGSTFWFELPLAPTQAQARPIDQDEFQSSAE